MGEKKISKNQYTRLPKYYYYLKELDEENIKFVDSKMLSVNLGFNEEQVRKDLQTFSSTKGVPNKGRNIKDLLSDIDQLLGLKKTKQAVLVGCGHLGSALLNYDGFKEFGLKIIGAYDYDEKLIGKVINGITIEDSRHMYLSIKRLNASIGIICVPLNHAKEALKELIDAGIEGIWNFTPVELKVPDNVIISNINMATSLLELSHKLDRKRIKGE